MSDEAKLPEAVIPSLSDQYHKARRQLMLWSGILFTWELVGIDFEKMKSVGGNIGALSSALKSPQAVPWVLLILIIYFSYRVVIEWSQCNLARRSKIASKIDYRMSLIVAIVAISLYFVQRLLEIETLEAEEFSALMEGEDPQTVPPGSSPPETSQPSPTESEQRKWNAPGLDLPPAPSPA